MLPRGNSSNMLRSDAILVDKESFAYPLDGPQRTTMTSWAIRNANPLATKKTNIELKT